MDQNQTSPVDTVLARYPQRLRERLQQLRDMLHEVAAQTDGVGPLTETLKWGEPAFVTAQSNSGSLVRIDRFKGDNGCAAVYFHCQTSLIEDFRALFGDALSFENNRAILLPLDQPLPEAELKICMAQALTYKKRRGCDRYR